MSEPSQHLKNAHYLMSEIDGLSHATDSEKQYNRAVFRNCLEAIEEAVAAGIAEKGEEIPDERSDRIEKLLGLYDCTDIPSDFPENIDATPYYEPGGPIEDALQYWSDFELSERDSITIKKALDDAESIIGGVTWLIALNQAPEEL